MKQFLNPEVQKNSGVSEVIGVIILVSLVVLAFGIISLVLVSQPQKEQIPEITTVIANITNSTTAQNFVYITHSGGDSLKTGQYRIFINHIDRTSKITSINGDNGDSNWNAGETLVVPLGNETPALVQIYYQGATTTDLLVEHTLQPGVEYSPAPTQPGAMVTAITPNSAITGDSVSITNLGGSGFQSGASVKLTQSGSPDISATSVNVISSNQITCQLNLAGAAAGSWNVVVTNPDMQTGTLMNGFTVLSLPPAVKAITPSSGNRGTIVAISNIQGTGFQSGATVKLIQTGQQDIIASGVTVVSPTQIACSFNLIGVNAGLWSVIVTNPDLQSGTLANGFTINSPAPTLTVRSPTSGNRGWPVNITLTGTGFQPGATPGMSRSGSSTITAFNIVVVSPTQITCTFDLAGAATGNNWAISVTNTDGRSSGKMSFTVSSPNPTVASISPATGQHGTQVTITNIAGTGFQPGAVVLFATNTGMNQNTMSLANVNVISATQISGLLNIPSTQSINTYYVRVTNTDGKNGRSSARIFNVV
ncbi:MAG TPA: type IV pilin N-terminal domain-containing protein [Methanoregulaceae archaeon]|nr:type IV pilin N-terminal domain-containing protein [Methanoregulaceae archaeon]